MDNIETIIVRFMGYNFLRGAVSEVSGSLKMIGGLSRETGQSMVDWNARSERAANAVGMAYERYAGVVAKSNKLIVNAAQDQAVSWKIVESAHLRVAAAADLQAQAEADLALIASRAYSLEADRADLNTAANDRLATAIGLRAIAERDAAVALVGLAQADARAANVAEASAAKQVSASRVIKTAYKEQAIVAQESSLAQIASMQRASTMALGLGAAFVIGGGILAGALMIAAGKAGEFESKIILLHTQARVATTQFGELRSGILEMAGATGFAAGKLADAMYLVESQGAGTITAAHALDILRAAAMGAAVGHSNLTQTTRALAAVMQVFPAIVGGPIAAMGALDAIVGQGMMTMEDLNAALRTGILATLKSSGIGLADFGGALATMTDYAIPATQAANALRMAIYLMSAPTMASDKVLKQFGLTTKEISSVSQEWTNKIEAAGIRHAKLADDLRKPGGLIIAMQDLRKHFEAAGLSAEGQAEAIYKAFGGGKMGKAIITLYENINSGSRASDAELKKLGFTTAEINTLNDRLIVKTAAVNAQAKLLGQNFQLIQDTDPAQMWKDLTASINSAFLALGYAFVPMLVATMRFLTPIVKGFTDWIIKNQDLAAAIGMGIIAFSLLFGFALIIVGALGLLAGAIASIVASGAGLGVVGIIFAGMAAAALILTGAVVFIHSIWDSLAELWSTRVVPAASRLWNSIKSIWDIISQGLKIVKPLFDTVFGDFKDTLSAQGGLWDDATKAFEDFTKSIITWIKSPAFATLVADFAVSLPVAIGLALDAMLLFGDAIQGAFTSAVGLALVVWYTATGQFWKIPGLVKSTTDAMAKIMDRAERDQLKSAKDFSKAFDGSYQQMWQQVYNNTMDATSKIGTDGSIAMLNAGQKMEAADLKAGIHRKKAAYRTFYDVGLAMTQGVADGVVGGAAGLFHAIDKLIIDAAKHAKDKNKSKSPSVLWAEEVGEPIPQGIWMGVNNELPALQSKMTTMMVGLVKQPPTDIQFPLPTISTARPSISNTSALNEKTLLEILIELKKISERRPTGPTTGVEALIYELTRRADSNRARGQKGYVP